MKKENNLYSRPTINASVCTKNQPIDIEESQTMLFSSWPGGGVEVGVLERLLDLGQEVPARGAISDVVTGRAAFVFSRVELPNDVSFAVPRMPDEGAPSLLSGKDFGILESRVVDTELGRHDTDIVESK